MKDVEKNLSPLKLMTLKSFSVKKVRPHNHSTVAVIVFAGQVEWKNWLDVYTDF